MIPGAFDPSDKQLRQFAWAAPVGLTLLGWMARRFGAPEWAPYAGAGIGLVMLVAGLARPRSLQLVYALAMFVAMPIGWVVSSLFLAIFYYGMLTPLALFFRAIGRDPLGVRGKSGATAWHARRPSGDAASYYRQG